MSAEDKDLPAVIGGCRIVRELGQGGMGVVYLGRSEKFGGNVAVELLKPEAAANEEVAKRYLRGAQVASKVKHPGIVHTYAAGLHHGCPYTVMEFVDGSDLMAVLDSYGPLPVASVLDVAEAVALAMGAAFEQTGLIHRDIKPDNIMVTRDGVVKVADLDLAKVVGDQDPDTFGGLTAAGVAMGTPYYMSPEQCLDSSTVDHRGDMFSLGATLYELLTGSHPFRGKTLYALMRNVVEKDPEPLPDKVPAPVRALVSRMLAKKPENRFKTYDELLTAIRLARSAVGTNGTTVISAKSAARSAAGEGDEDGDKYVTLPFYRMPEGLLPAPHSPGDKLKSLLEKGCVLIGELHSMGRDFIFSNRENLPAGFRTRFSNEPAVVQAAIEIMSAETGLYETAATAVDRQIDDIREVRRNRRRPASAAEIHVRPGTAILQKAAYPVRIFRQGVTGRDGRLVGRVLLVLFDL